LLDDKGQVTSTHCGLHIEGKVCYLRLSCLVIEPNIYSSVFVIIYFVDGIRTCSGADALNHYVYCLLSENTGPTPKDK